GGQSQACGEGAHVRDTARLEEVGMPKAAVGDVELYYETRGAGAPLLLIAGFGANSAIFQPEFVEQLARTFRVVTFDNRGTGRSDKPEGPLASTQLADDVVATPDVV